MPWYLNLCQILLNIVTLTERTVSTLPPAHECNNTCDISSGIRLLLDLSASRSVGRSGWQKAATFHFPARQTDLSADRKSLIQIGDIYERLWSGHKGRQHTECEHGLRHKRERDTRGPGDDYGYITWCCVATATGLTNLQHNNLQMTNLTVIATSQIFAVGNFDERLCR